MKVGLLTLHDSINYGALLQAYALSRVYRMLGHDPVLIDRRRDPFGAPLKSDLSGLNFLRRTAWFLNATGIRREQERRRRTLAFLRDKIGLTSYHFTDWRDAPSDLGVDLVSVGSDQVWNASIHDPLDYLPGRIPSGLPVISYAASIGMPRLPDTLEEDFRSAVRNFKAVSVREETAVSLLAEMGVSARQVVDPVVLAGRKVWEELLERPIEPSGRVVFYMLGGDSSPHVEKVVELAERYGVEVDFFVGRMLLDPLSHRGHPRLFKNLRLWRRFHRSSRVHFHLEDGPASFVRAIAGASAVVTGSYHALLFAILFGRDVRFIVPGASTPQAAMMVRIRDYAEKIVRGPLLQPSVEAAFASVAAGERTKIEVEELERRRQASLAWLKEAIGC